MLFDKLVELVDFCKTIDGDKLVKMINDAGFIVKRKDIHFVEVVEIRNKTVYVAFLDNDKMSDTYGEECQVHFDWEDGKITKLDFVQQN